MKTIPGNAQRAAPASAPFRNPVWQSPIGISVFQNDQGIVTGKGFKRWLIVLAVAATATAPAASADDFEFAVIGDTRPRFESESFRQFETLIATINPLKPALVVNVGDLIYGYGPISKEKQWDKYQTVIKSIQVPYHQVPGNHDTHSKEARKIYGQRFGKFYQSFDSGNCHFVLLDNTEEGRWGYLGSDELAWLRDDLKATQARMVFVFLHFPVWEPERVTSDYYEFWAKTLHPLFKKSRVRAVFAGHYHAYGPTREFDGIRYFITGGGGAELRPEYEKSGGEYHFMKIHVSGDTFEVRVITERGELTDAEADVMGGLQFAARNVSRLGLKRDAQDLRAGTTFTISVQNPYRAPLTGRAEWVVDTSAFSVQPRQALIEIPPAATGQYQFAMRVLRDEITLESVPRLEFDLAAGRDHHKFGREAIFLEELNARYQPKAITLDGQLGDWTNVPVLRLNEAQLSRAELRSCYDTRNLYLALVIPWFDTAEARELGFTDEVQIGMSRRLSKVDFSADLLRFGLNSDSTEVANRTPDTKTGMILAGAKTACRMKSNQITYETAIPLRLLKRFHVRPGSSLILDLSFPGPECKAENTEHLPPRTNSFSYRIRYGNDSLVPAYFVELEFQPKR